jgi:hypothetical protein
MATGLCIGCNRTCAVLCCAVLCSGGGGAAAIEQLAQEHGYRAVRFNPYLWREGEKMTNEVTRS